MSWLFGFADSATAAEPAPISRLRRTKLDVEFGIECDYLVVGAGLTGLAFADELATLNPRAKIVIADPNPEPGGAWVNAYDFVRLTCPREDYGVNSLPFNAVTNFDAKIDAGTGQPKMSTTSGSAAAESAVQAKPEERASKREVLRYCRSVAKRLERKGNVRFFFQAGYKGAFTAGTSTPAEIFHLVEIKIEGERVIFDEGLGGSSAGETSLYRTQPKVLHLDETTGKPVPEVSTTRSFLMARVKFQVVDATGDMLAARTGQLHGGIVGVRVSPDHYDVKLLPPKQFAWLTTNALRGNDPLTEREPHRQDYAERKRKTGFQHLAHRIVVQYDQNQKGGAGGRAGRGSHAMNKKKSPNSSGAGSTSLVVPAGARSRAGAPGVNSLVLTSSSSDLTSAGGGEDNNSTTSGSDGGGASPGGLTARAQNAAATATRGNEMNHEEDFEDETAYTSQKQQLFENTRWNERELLEHNSEMNHDMDFYDEQNYDGNAYDADLQNLIDYEASETSDLSPALVQHHHNFEAVTHNSLQVETTSSEVEAVQHQDQQERTGTLVNTGTTTGTAGESNTTFEDAGAKMRPMIFSTEDRMLRKDSQPALAAPHQETTSIPRTVSALRNASSTMSPKNIFALHDGAATPGGNKDFRTSGKDTLVKTTSDLFRGTNYTNRSAGVSTSPASVNTATATASAAAPSRPVFALPNPQPQERDRPPRGRQTETLLSGAEDSNATGGYDPLQKFVNPGGRSSAAAMSNSSPPGAAAGFRPTSSVFNATAQNYRPESSTSFGAVVTTQRHQGAFHKNHPTPTVQANSIPPKKQPLTTLSDFLQPALQGQTGTVAEKIGSPKPPPRQYLSALESLPGFMTTLPDVLSSSSSEDEEILNATSADNKHKSDADRRSTTDGGNNTTTSAAEENSSKDTGKMSNEKNKKTRRGGTTIGGTTTTSTANTKKSKLVMLHDQVWTSKSLEDALVAPPTDNAASYIVIGGGQTGVDCISDLILRKNVDPDQITWILLPNVNYRIDLFDKVARAAGMFMRGQSAMDLLDEEKNKNNDATGGQKQQQRRELGKTTTSSPNLPTTTITAVLTKPEMRACKQVHQILYGKPTRFVDKAGEANSVVEIHFESGRAVELSHDGRVLVLDCASSVHDRATAASLEIERDGASVERVWTTAPVLHHAIEGAGSSFSGGNILSGRTNNETSAVASKKPPAATASYFPFSLLTSVPENEDEEHQPDEENQNQSNTSSSSLNSGNPEYQFSNAKYINLRSLTHVAPLNQHCFLATVIAFLETGLQDHDFQTAWEILHDEISLSAAEAHQGLDAEERTQRKFRGPWSVWERRVLHYLHKSVLEKAIFPGEQNQRPPTVAEVFVLQANVRNMLVLPFLVVGDDNAFYQHKSSMSAPRGGGGFLGRSGATSSNASATSSHNKLRSGLFNTKLQTHGAASNNLGSNLLDPLCHTPAFRVIAALTHYLPVEVFNNWVKSKNYHSLTSEHQRGEDAERNAGASLTTVPGAASSPFAPPARTKTAPKKPGQKLPKRLFPLHRPALMERVAGHILSKNVPTPESGCGWGFCNTNLGAL
ncbi:unnamed protein product [Amoebophrya sp. A120]|nr:unnamed protein product [Amoebophrya sp. A120]|eukprot:GSA120T00019976001.1